MRFIYKITSSIIALLFISTCYCQVNSVQIDSIINSAIQIDGPGVIVYLKKGDSVFYENAFGKSNIELNVNMTTKNVVNIASVSKEFTAISILQLIEKGKLSFEDKLNSFIPNYSKNGDNIKIKHLLSHTSGLKSHTDTIWANTDARKYFNSTLEVINYFKKDTIKFQPGERHDYSNINFNILAYIIEKVSGLTYTEYIEKNILEPLEMTNTTIPNEGELIMNQATGYEFKDGKMVHARYHSVNQTRGSSSIHTTVEDLSKWYDGLMQSKVISRETLQKAWSPYQLNNGDLSQYGYGFYNDQKFNKTAIFHNGFIFGYSTSDLYFPEDELLILVVSNISDITVINTNALIFNIAASVYNDNSPKISVDLLDTYVGFYKMNDGFRAKIYREGLQLFISVDGQPANKLFPESQSLFVVKDFPAKAEFIPASGNQMNIILSMGPDRFQGVKEKK
ncbi:serine hydrolase [Psychroserpens sp. AS72]|uniref:serine hydrolase n=1 Tax=Psychroserpens sp. AS72 TaxID=3135775 RepID=UPI0031764240